MMAFPVGTWILHVLNLLLLVCITGLLIAVLVLVVKLIKKLK